MHFKCSGKLLTSIKSTAIDSKNTFPLPTYIYIRIVSALTLNIIIFPYLHNSYLFTISGSINKTLLNEFLRILICMT